MELKKLISKFEMFEGLDFSHRITAVGPHLFLVTEDLSPGVVERIKRNFQQRAHLFEPAAEVVFLNRFQSIKASITKKLWEAAEGAIEQALDVGHKVFHTPVCLAVEIQEPVAKATMQLVLGILSQLMEGLVTEGQRYRIVVSDPVNEAGLQGNDDRNLFVVKAPDREVISDSDCEDIHKKLRDCIDVESLLKALG